METAMEQRNASSTLASFGQDAGDFGPETDVDTPDEPIGLTKPKVEGEANVIYESGEDSEEDNSGWNYYKKSATEEKKTSNNSDAEDDMDYKLNPDAPEFVPVSSPPAMNHAQRFVNMETDDLILSSPQKYKDTIDHMDVPDEKEFTNEIKMHAADLSKFGNLIEPTKSTDDSTMLNNTKPENEEVTTEHNENFLIKNEHIANENMEKYTNPFVSDTDDLNKVQDLSEYIKDDAHENITGINVSMIETSKINELDSASGNELENESNIKLNNHLLMNEHITYEQGMNLKNNDDATNVIIDDSILPQNNELFKRNDDFKNEFLDNSNNDKYSHYDDHKLNDSVSTTDAVIGSEPNTPMRMDNQSTFESENDDDQLSESFKQQLKFNQFDENNDKENHDPFCFELTEDSAGIIPNAINKENETVDETFNDDNTIPNISSNIDHVSESIKHEPVEEPLCIKEKAKPIHLVSEEQLPELDIPANTHEPLLNTSENNINTKYFEEQEIVESEDKNEQEISDKLLAQEVYNPESVITNHTENIEQDDSEEDDIKDHIASQQEFYQDNMYNLEQENLVNNQNEDLKSEYDNVNDYKIENHTSYIQDHDEHFAKSEYDNVNDNDNKIENHTSYIQDHDEHFAHHNPNEESINYHEDLKHNIVSDVVKDCIEEFHENVTEVICNNTEHFKNENKSNVEDIQNYVENVKQHDIAEIETQDQVEHLNEKENNILEIKNNYGEDFKHEHQDNIENIDVENNVINSIKEEHNSVTELVQNHNGDFQLENYGVESIENRTVDSDEEMHSSMIIHSDVENNMPQPYCSSHDTLLNEPNMMSTSMTFEENFHNRNMNDSLYVMETSSDYFGEELEQATQINKSINETKADEQLSNIDSEIIEPNKIENKIISEPKSTVEEIEAESTELNQLSSQDYHIENNENIDKQEDNNKVSEIAIATVVGAAAIAAVTGASLTSKKSTPKKVETTVSKVKTTTTKTTPTKPLSSKTSTPPIKKTTASTTTSKPISRPLTAPSTTSKPTANVRPTTAPKTTVLKTSTVTAKVLPKTVPKTAISSSRPNSAKTTSTTPRTSLTKTTTSKSPTPKSTVITKPSTPPKTNTPRTSTLISKQTLTNGSPKSLSRPSTAPAKKPLSNGIANGTSNLTNGDGVKTSTTTKSPITLATRMSLAPPKMPPKVKAAPKTVVAPPMPGPIRRPKAPITKKD